MGAYKKADFYYGAFLSVLFNNGITPALIEKDGEMSRRRFKITTYRGEYEVYYKYVCSSTGKTNLTWSFSFSPNEIDELQKLLSSKKALIFALLCLQKDVTSINQELAIVKKSDFMQCVKLNTYKDSAPRISVKYIKKSKYLYIYGSDRSDKIGKEDNTIRIERNGISLL